MIETTLQSFFDPEHHSILPCRRSVEALLQKLYETCESESLEPLVITEDALVSVSRNHIYGSPSALANLFVDQVSKLEAVIQSHWGTGGYGAGSKKSSKVGGRCAAHSLGLLNNGKRGGGVIGGGGGGHWTKKVRSRAKS